MEACNVDCRTTEYNAITLVTKCALYYATYIPTRLLVWIFCNFWKKQHTLHTYWDFLHENTFDIFVQIFLSVWCNDLGNLSIYGFVLLIFQSEHFAIIGNPGQSPEDMWISWDFAVPYDHEMTVSMQYLRYLLSKQPNPLVARQIESVSNTGCLIVKWLFIDVEKRLKAIHFL